VRVHQEDQVQNLLLRYNILSDDQSGFRHRDSTINQLLVIYDVIMKNLDIGKDVILVYNIGRSCEDGRTYIYTISKILINQLSDVFEVFPDSSRATIFLSKNNKHLQ
jgi:hypothetical protein